MTILIISCAPFERTDKPAAAPAPTVESKVPEPAHDPKESILTGEYVDPVYGFSVKIPDGLNGEGAPEPLPAQGIKIDLSKKDEAAVSAYAQYNALFYTSLDEAYQEEMKFLRDDAKSLKLNEKKPAALGKLPALSFTVSYTARLTLEERIVSQITAMRKCTEEDDIDQIEVIYTLRLDTTKQRYNKDKTIMKKVADSWVMLDKCS